MDTWVLPKFNDMHVHFRQPEEAGELAKIHEQYCANVMPMPNTMPPILDACAALEYKELVEAAAPGLTVTPVIKLTSETTPQELELCAEKGVNVVKLYPEGVTTNSEDGVISARLIQPQLEVLSKLGMILSVHAELPNVFVTAGERAYMNDEMSWIWDNFPNLTTVIEHVSCADTIQTVRWRYEDGHPVAATITAHHLMLTLNDVIGTKLEPRNFCKPVAQGSHDRRDLIAAAIGDDDCFFFGSDSAPHDWGYKFCDHGCAGVFSAPNLPEFLAEVFDNHAAKDKLADFATNRAAEFYSLEKNEETFTLVKELHEVGNNRPVGRKNYVPFRGSDLQGGQLQWKLLSD